MASAKISSRKSPKVSIKSLSNAKLLELSKNCKPKLRKVVQDEISHRKLELSV